MNVYDIVSEVVRYSFLKFTPPQLSKWMSNNFDYGIVVNGKVFKNWSGPFFMEHYRLQSPSELMKSKVGVCWDQVELERVFFEANEIPHKTIYCWLHNKADTIHDSHTFLIYEKDGNTYYFENAFHAIRGIHGPFRKIESILSIVKKAMLKNYTKEKLDFYFCYYTKPHYGVTCQQFMDHAIKDPKKF
jgi:hypothetical protein